MNRLKTAMYVQMIYMAGMGAAFLAAPGIMLPVFGFDPPTEVWVRVLGALVLVLTWYYYVSVTHEFLPFIRASVWGRYLFCVALVAFGLTGWTQPAIYLFAGLEAALAFWAQMNLPKS